jgi:hypothetical protein
MDPEHSSEAPVAAQAIVRMVGSDHALVIGDPATVRRFGEVELRVPGPMMKVVGAMVAAAPGIAGMAADAGGHVVRLTEQSMALLSQHGGLVGADGALLGVVKAADGKFAGVLTFEPVGPLAGLAPGLPVLLSAMAMQAQLLAIERKLDDIQADIDTIIRDGHIEVLAEARAALRILDDVHGDVIASGQLADGDWERVVPLELAVRKLHEQAGAHLRDLEHRLGQVEGGLGPRLQALRRVARHGEAGFWFQTYVVAEAAVAKWDFLRLVRLATEADSRLEREVRQADAALRERRDFVISLTRRLGDYLADAGRIDGMLQRIRIIARARLEQLILDLDAMLAAYREWVPDAESTAVVEPAQLGESSGAVAAIAPAAADAVWSKIASQTRQHSGSLVRRAGDTAGKAGDLLLRTARVPTQRIRMLRSDEEGLADEDNDDSPPGP